MKAYHEPDDDLVRETDPACAQSLESLHLRLDGVLFQESAEVLSHRASCANCQSLEESSRRLMDGLKLDRPDAPPSGFADRVVERYQSEALRPSAKRSRWLWAGLALAASVTVAVVSIQLLSKSVESQVTIVSRPTPVERKSDSLGDSINDAGNAVVSLAKKTGLDGFNLKLPTLALPKTGPLDRLEPALSGMQSLGNGAVLSVAPLTNSAKRAADLFWRELNGPDEMKPTSN